MTLPTSLCEARNRFKRHLDGCDWSELTAGRKRILEVFLRLASIEGYSAVTMRTLAKEASVKAASIYFHFPGGRSEIVAQSLRWHYSNWGYSILEAIDKASEPEQFWDVLVSAVARCQISIPASDLWDLLVRMDRAGGFLETEFRREIDHWLDLCADLFQASAAAIGYPVDRGRVNMIMSILDAGSNWSEWNGDAADLDAIAEQAIIVSRAILSAPMGSLRRTAAPDEIAIKYSR
ncbi:TetR/AcrR family transcriptional regulator [Rhizobium phaseoli]|uniref:TetR/AcrR family transcriptional regulator n=1 Tax=Rhizobium phaseoli TaxID=396 RepID=UPI0014386A48|nr:TetR/AcrR family transcriptional regulator [Rhizobium phaseoli]MDK4730803.1 TetR/AcrR family transcriptional regulator [Rhizobium phaseoli]NKE92178.1 TetR/AcrR family transcriptional regulator [Rhizobium phaseoli]